MSTNCLSNLSVYLDIEIVCLLEIFESLFYTSLLVSGRILYVFLLSAISMDKELSGIARFNGDEFHIWKWQIRALLQYRKVFGLPAGTDLEADAIDKDAWKEREYLAYSILCNSVERKILSSLLDCKTSREIWTTLLSLYEQNTSENLHDLQKKFFQATILPEQTITEYIAGLNLILSELAALGDKTFNEQTMISKLLSSLPEGFDHFLTSWVSTPVSEQTLTNLKLRLIKEEQKIKKRLINETTSATSVFYSNSSDSRGRYPGRFSHSRSQHSGRSPNQWEKFRSEGYNSNSGRGYRGLSSSRRGILSNQDRRQSHFSQRYTAAELAHVKQHTRCIECGAYGHWRQECPRLSHLDSNTTTESLRDFRSSRVHLADASSSLVKSDVSSLNADNVPSHDDLFHDTVEQLQLDDSYSTSSNSLPGAYMAMSSSFSSKSFLEEWIADSGANQHMSHKFEWFSSYKPLSSEKSWPITSVAGHKTYVAGTGTIRFLIQLPDRTEIFTLENVLYVPGFDCNLFSTTTMARKHGFIFTGSANQCTFTKNDQVYLTGRLKNGMYVLDVIVLLPKTHASHAHSFGNIPQTQERQSLQTWHHRFAHLNYEMIKQMERKGSVLGFQLTKREPDHLCVGCQFGKHHRASFPVNTVRTRFPNPGDLIHADICGPMSVPSYGGSVYFVLFKDDATHYRFVFCIKRKSEALGCFQKVCTSIKKDTGCSVQSIRTDRGGEFANKAFDQYLAAHSIRREYTAPYTPEQNSVAERENRTVMEGVRSCLHHARINLRFWAEAVQYLVYTLNRTGTRILSDYTPFEAYFGVPPSVSHLRPFGCPTYVHIPAPSRKKLDPKVLKDIFLGYSDESKAFRIWISDKSQVVTSRDVIFDEDHIVKFRLPESQHITSKPSLIPPVITSVPLSSSILSSVDTILPVSPPGAISSSAISPQNSSYSQHSQDLSSPVSFSTEDPYDFSTPSSSNPHDLSSQPTNPGPVSVQVQTNSSEAVSDENSHPTLNRRGVNPPVRYGDWYYAFSAMAGTLPPVPKTYKEAINSPFASQWKAAMDEEFNSLITNKTWRLTALPPGRKVIRCKWVYALKTKPDGSIDRFKARLVAKGYSQVPGIDFHETFSPTVKYDSIRIILALVASLDLHVRQFDIKTAFLYGSIQEDIYMEQVEGYVDPKWIDAVCKILQALYGLRQSSRAWSKKMESFLIAFGLTQSTVDQCVYYSRQDGIITIVTIFVDDGLICSNSSDRIASILKFMSDVFVTKVTDPEVYVGLHLIRDRKQRTISIDQERYIQEKIVVQYGLQDAHPVTTLLTITHAYLWLRILLCFSLQRISLFLT